MKSTPLTDFSHLLQGEQYLHQQGRLVSVSSDVPNFSISGPTTRSSSILATLGIRTGRRTPIKYKLSFRLTRGPGGVLIPDDATSLYAVVKYWRAHPRRHPEAEVYSGKYSSKLSRLPQLNWIHTADLDALISVRSVDITYMSRAMRGNIRDIVQKTS